MRFTWVQKLSIGTGSALGLLALLGFVSYVGIHQMIGGQRAIAATNTNLERIDVVVSRTLDAENAQRGYVTTGDARFTEPLNDAVSDVEDAIQGLTKTTEDNPDQRRNLDRLAPLVSKRFKEINAVIALRKRSGMEPAIELLKSHNAVRDRDGIGPTAARMHDEELRVLGERTRSVTKAGENALGFILGGSVFALLLALFALQPLRPSVERRLRQRLAKELLAAPPAAPTAATDDGHQAGDRLVRLQQVIAALSVSATPAEVARALLTRGAPPFVASLGFAAAGNGSALTVLSALGELVPQLAQGSLVPDALAAPLTEAMRTRKVVIVESRTERSRRYPLLGRFSAGGALDGAFAAVPLAEDEHAHGVLLLAFTGDRTFDDADRAYLATLGALGGQGLARAERA